MTWKMEFQQSLLRFLHENGCTDAAKIIGLTTDYQEPFGGWEVDIEYRPAGSKKLQKYYTYEGRFEDLINALTDAPKGPEKEN